MRCLPLLLTLGALLPSPSARAAPWDEAASVPVQWLGEARPPARPRRIVTLAPSLTEWLFALGEGSSVVAVSRYDERPAEVRALPRVGGFLDPSVEAIVAARPELVLAAPSASNRAALERVAALKIPVLVLPGNRFADVFHTLRALGAALGPEASKRAEAQAEQLRASLTALAAKVRGAPAPKVAVVYGWSPLVLGGPQSFAGTLLLALGANNVVQSGPDYPQYSPEALLLGAPEVLLDASELHGTSGARPPDRFGSLPAVKSGRVHSVGSSGLLVPGPRLAEAMEQLARLLYPARFPAR